MVKLKSKTGWRNRIVEDFDWTVRFYRWTRLLQARYAIALCLADA